MFILILPYRWAGAFIPIVLWTLVWRYLVGEGDPVLLFLILLAGTASEAFLEEADLFAERVDAIQLLEGVGQEAGFLRHALVQRHGE